MQSASRLVSRPFEEAVNLEDVTGLEQPSPTAGIRTLATAAAQFMMISVR